MYENNFIKRILHFFLKVCLTVFGLICNSGHRFMALDGSTEEVYFETPRLSYHYHSQHNLYRKPRQGEHNSDNGDKFHHPSFVSQGVLAYPGAASLKRICC